MKRNMLYLLILLPILGSTSLHAGVKGKLAGKVVDQGTGEVLPGTNVIITAVWVGDKEIELQNIRGAATDTEGEYFILNIDPGLYTVKATMIGYRTTTFKKVRINANLTTRLDFKLEQTVLKGEAVTIVAERKLIRADITSKFTSVSKEQMESMPIENFVDVLAVQPGFIKDEGGALHVRGGRGNEIAYMVDGVYISDPLYGEFSNLVLDKTNVQELQILSGTFSAEYGRAMSGLVNIITKSPSREFRYDFEYLSPYINKSPYRKRNAVARDVNPVRVVKDSLDGEVFSRYDTLYYNPTTLRDFYEAWDKKNLLGQFRGSLSGGVPFFRKLTFFLSGRYLNENSIYPHGFNLQREFMGKLMYQFSPNIRLSYLHQYTSQENQGYSHSFKYLPKNQGITRRFNELNNLIWTHTLSPSTFYNLRISRYRSSYDYDVPGLKILIGSDRVPIYTEYEVPRYSEGGEFVTAGHDATLQYEDVETYSIKFDVTSQITKHQQIKLGVDFSKHQIDRYRYLNPYLGTDILHDFQDYHRKPYEGAFYVQNKIEYDYVILNVGLRLDYFNPADSMWSNIYQPPYYYRGNELVWEPLHKVKTKWYLSPRLGIAHPVTENTVIHFAYGFFYQRPDFVHLYYSRDITQVLLYPAGNPETEAQKTIAYEVGIKHQFSPVMALHLTGFYKDVFYLQGTSYQNFSPYSYPIFDNSNYASLKGIEFSLEKRYSHYYSATLNYTFSFANTRESRAVPPILYGASSIRPRRVFPASWDQRHVFGVNLIVSFPQNTGPQIIGFKPLERIKFNFLISAGSGFPYTPWLGVREEYWRRALTINAGRKPWTIRVDLRWEKEFDFFGYNSKFIVKVLNLFDRRNSIVVEPVTGRTWDPGPFYSGSEDALKNPTHYDTPRQIYLGFAISH